MSTPEPTDTTAHHGGLAWLVVLAPAALVFLIGVGLVMGMALLRQRNIDWAQTNNQAIAGLIAEQTTRTLQTVEQLLDTLEHRLQTAPHHRQSGSLLRDPQAQLPYVLALWWLDPRGEVLQAHDPLQLNSARAWLAPGEWSALLQARSDTPRWLPSRTPTPGGRWVLQVAKPVYSPSGQLRGVLVAAVDHDYFYRLWEQVELGEEGSISVMSRAADFYLRQPLVPEAMAKNYADRPVFKNLLPYSDHGVYSNPSGVDGVLRLYAYEVPSSRPDLVVLVGQSDDYVLARWRRAAQMMALLWCMLALAGAGVSLLARRWWRSSLAARVAAQQHARELQVLSGRILKAQELERARIARELHDELAQTLTAIKINIQTAQRSDPAQAPALASENLRVINDALQQIRTLALTLRPSLLDNLGLPTALQWLAKDMARRSGFALELDVTPLTQRLDSDLETCFFRVAQEALTNIARHAQAHRVELSLYLQGRRLHLRVQDDGVGLPPTVSPVGEGPLQSAGLGLQGMRERAALVGGTLELETRAGKGCTVLLVCPVRYAAPHP